MMNEKNKKKSFAEKFPAMDKKAVKTEIKVQEKAKDEMTAQALEIEKNFTSFGDVTDPIQWKDPSTGKFKDIALVRRPTMKERKEMVPPEYAKYAGKKIPKELEEEYATFMYQQMSKLIILPKKTAEEWERDASPWFMKLFWTHIKDIVVMIEGKADSFLEPQ